MKTPFKLRSGNTSSFKNMGSSPVKQGTPSTPTTPKRLPKTLILGQSYEGFSDADWERFGRAHETQNAKAWKGLKKGVFSGIKTGIKRFPLVDAIWPTSLSASDQPTYESTGDPRYKKSKIPKSEGQQIKDLLTKHKLKGGRK